MRSTALVLVACALIGTAGCGGIPSQADGETPSTTLQGTSNDHPEWTGVDSPDSQFDAGDLVSNHSEQLLDDPYSITVVVSERYGNDTLRTEERRAASYTRERRALEYDYSVNGTVSKVLGSPNGTVESWSNGSARFTRIAVDGSTTYRTGIPDVLPTDYSDRLYHLLNIANVSIEADRTGGTEIDYVLEATGFARVNDISATAGATDVRNVSMTARVDARGFVESMRLSYEYDRRNHTIRRTEDVDVVIAESNSIEKPPWVGNASGAAMQRVNPPTP